MIGAIAEKLGGWLAPADSAKNLRTEIRRLIAERPKLERELEAAQERLRVAEAALDLVGPAQAAFESTQQADAADRRKRMEEGTTTPDPALTAKVAAAEAALVEAERTQAAAEAALPTLRRRVAEVTDAIKDNASQIDSYIWQVAVSELAADAPAARQAAETLTTFRRSVATLAEVGRRPGFFGAPRGRVPRELLDIAAPKDIVVNDSEGIALGHRLAAMRRNV